MAGALVIFILLVQVVHYGIMRKLWLVAFLAPGADVKNAFKQLSKRFMSATSLIIGLTGNIATGKTTILEHLAAKGAHIIDADKLGHKVMEPGRPAYQSIVDEFGPKILTADGMIDRRALGKIVFSDVAKLGRLEQIVHPAVFELMLKDINTAKASVIVLEAVKLLEAGAMATLCDEIWVVAATPEVQLQRLIENRGMSEAQARQRMQMQSPQAAKINQATRVIYNSGSVEQLHAQLDKIWKELAKKYPERLTSPAL